MYSIKSSKLVDALLRESDWLLSQRDQRPAEKAADRVRALVVGCVGVLSQSVRDYSGWQRRKDRLKLIRTAHQHYTKRKHNQALRDLVELAASDVEANHPWQPDVVVPMVLWDAIKSGPPKSSTNTCERCGSPFISQRKSARFCGNTCRQRSRRKACLSR